MLILIAGCVSIPAENDCSKAIRPLSGEIENLSRQTKEDILIQAMILCEGK